MYTPKPIDTTNITLPEELLALTGYIRGGCSPVGMKKRFPTFFLCVMLFALGLDTVEAVVKTLKK